MLVVTNFNKINIICEAEDPKDCCKCKVYFSVFTTKHNILFVSVALSSCTFWFQMLDYCQASNYSCEKYGHNLHWCHYIEIRTVRIANLTVANEIKAEQNFLKTKLYIFK